MTIYVTGGRGRLGSELVRLGCTPIECDITNLYQVKDALADTTPDDILIHTAAYTDVDGSQGDEHIRTAFRINVRGTAQVRDFHQGRMILISTDYIFSGKNGPYRERSIPKDSVNDYGLTKLAAEAIISMPLRKGDTIVRTTGLYGGPSGKPDFLNLVIHYLSAGKVLDVIKTLYGNQTYIPHLAEALIDLAMLDNPPSILNLGSREVISRYEFSLMIASVFGLDKSLLNPVSKVEGWIAPRPTKGGLRVDLARKLGLPIYSILDGLKSHRENLYHPASV